eukprot:scaffold249406_cov33-Tisochrysis_lutea.AAC.1
MPFSFRAFGSARAWRPSPAQRRLTRPRQLAELPPLAGLPAPQRTRVWRQPPAARPHWHVPQAGRMRPPGGLDVRQHATQWSRCSCAGRCQRASPAISAPRPHDHTAQPHHARHVGAPAVGGSVEWAGEVVGSEIDIGACREEGTHYFLPVLLRRHIEWSEPLTHRADRGGDPRHEQPVDRAHVTIA